MTDTVADSAVTRRGQTVVPAPIRHGHGIRAGDRLVWLDDGDVIRVIPVPADPVAALRGCGLGEALLARLLSARREDRDRGS
jgi:AbrB family looped-hinge helix DNA binding protein